ncbi:MAG: preprotein translocase subunit SecE [bacterium]
MNSLTLYIREVIDELKQVSWPSKKQVVRDTALVVGISALVALFLGVLDFALSNLLQYIINNY